MSELVKISIENNVADVRFNRPEKYNALSFDMIDAMADAINRLAKEPGVRVVVISGEGKSFCAGLDIENFAAMQSGENKFPQSHGSIPEPDYQHLSAYRIRMERTARAGHRGHSWSCAGRRFTDRPGGRHSLLHT